MTKTNIVNQAAEMMTDEELAAVAGGLITRAWPTDPIIPTDPYAPPDPIYPVDPIVPIFRRFLF